MTNATSAYLTFLKEIAADPGIAAVAPSEDSILRRYRKGINRGCQVAASAAERRAPDQFAPPLALPELTSAYAEFVAPARMRICELGEHRSARISLFDLMRDECTNTTKIFPSLAMVLRAVGHVHATGENVLMLCTTSGNKGTAIRAAVERAYALRLVQPEQLRVVMILPSQSAGKLRGSILWRDRTLRRLNPVLLYDGAEPADVKRVGKAFHEECSAELRSRRNTRLWYSLDLDNYRTVDAARAFFEYEHFRDEAASARKVFHVHSVSSAFGLIGHRFGRALLESAGICSRESAPGYLLVQHLATPDMVLHFHHGSFSRTLAPRYAVDERIGQYTQQSCEFFPRVADDPDEVLDATFYTRQPITSPFASEMLRTYGGNALVVSRQECLERYAATRELLAIAGIALPENPRQLAEWSMVMAFTGVFNALERGLLPRDAHVVVHGSGSYAHCADPIELAELQRLTDGDAVATLKSLVG